MNMKKERVYKVINLLIGVMIILRIINRDYFIKVNNMLWIIVTIVLIVLSVYLTIKLDFIQFRFGKIIKSLFTKQKSQENTITSLESLSISMAGRIGVGSLSGIAIAIFEGGPGVIFWMWMSSIIFSILTYCESYLGVKYQKKEKDSYQGDPSYYIKKGLQSPKLAILYSIMIILAYIVGFLGIQSNTIVKSVHHLSNIDTLLITLILCIITMFVIFGKTKRIVSITSNFVPVMTILYIVMGIYIIINSIHNIPSILKMIVKSAFQWKTGIISVIIIGIQRGLFASESGIGSAAIASGSTNDTPNKQGLIQLFGVHFTTLIICTISALIVLNSNYNLLEGNINGIEIMILAFYQNFGKIGSYLLCIITILFAFSTIVSGYFFGESSLKYLKKHLTNGQLLMFKIFVLLLIFIGGLIRSNIIWAIVDLFVLLLTIINTYSIFKLRKNIQKELDKT